MDFTQLIQTALASAPTASIFAIATVYIYRQYTKHLEDEITYLRTKHDDLEKRLITLEQPK